MPGFLVAHPNDFQSTLTPNPENIYIYIYIYREREREREIERERERDYSGVKQEETCICRPPAPELERKHLKSAFKHMLLLVSFQSNISLSLSLSLYIHIYIYIYIHFLG